ncbi:MAG: hypothetical protein K8S15_10845 [Candidatus Aegiribacteria sp.]|nr:hypothetical protein [Candidatus Aegiribacteria sp.]
MRYFVLAIPLTFNSLYAGSLALLRQESLEIPVARYRTVNFVLPEHKSDSASLIGTVQIFPDTASVELILLHVDDYLRWRNNVEPVDTLEFMSVSSGSFELEVPGLGSYSIIVSNRGNYRPVTVILDLDVTFAGAGKTGDPLPSALRLALVLMMAGTVAVAVGSVLSKYLYKRKHVT